MQHVSTVHLIGHQIADLIGRGLTIPRVTHASIQVDYVDGSHRTIEAGPGRGRKLVECDYGDRSQPLYDLPIAAPPGQTLDGFADRIERGERNFIRHDVAYSYFPPFERNSNALVSGLLRHAGADIDRIDDAVGARVTHAFTPGLRHPLADRFFEPDP